MVTLFSACLQRARRVFGLALNYFVLVASLQTALSAKLVVTLYSACLQRARRVFGLALNYFVLVASLQPSYICRFAPNRLGAIFVAA